MSHNLQLYAYANPIRYIDRTGLSSAEAFTAGVISRLDLSSVRSVQFASTWTVGPLPPSAVLRRLWPDAYCPGGPDDQIEDYELLRILDELRTYGLVLKEEEGGTWTLDNGSTTLDAVSRVAGQLYNALPPEILSSESRFVWRMVAKDVFRTFFSSLELVQKPFGTIRDNSGTVRRGWFGKSSGKDRIELAPNPESGYWTTNRQLGMYLVAHELGHIFSTRLENAPSEWVVKTTGNSSLATAAGGSCVLDPTKDPTRTTNEAVEACNRWHKGVPGFPWSEANAYELWAEVFRAWVFNAYYSQKDPPEAAARGSFWREKAWEYMSDVVAAKYGG